MIFLWIYLIGTFIIAFGVLPLLKARDLILNSDSFHNESQKVDILIGTIFWPITLAGGILYVMGNFIFYCMYEMYVWVFAKMENLFKPKLKMIDDPPLNIPKTDYRNFSYEKK